MKQHKYEDYDQYVESQIAVNKRKLARWPNCHQVNDETLFYLAKWIKDHISERGKGICHGARNGYEVVKLKQFLPEYEIIGTDISSTAENYDLMQQWDFHKTKEDWLNTFDFVYCNCLDHAYSAEEAITTWLKQIKEKGVLIVEWTPFHGGDVNDPNCFSAEKKEYFNLLDTLGVVVDILAFRILNRDPTCTMPKRNPYEVTLFIVKSNS